VAADFLIKWRLCVIDLLLVSLLLGRTSSIQNFVDMLTPERGVENPKIQRYPFSRCSAECLG